MLKRIIPFTHELIQQAIKPGDIVIDATCGNGHDTVMLSQAVMQTGKVYAFDIQKEAIDKTRLRLEQEALINVQLIHDSHEQIDKHLADEHHNEVSAAIFNLGYLPGSDKSVITKPDVTLAAINNILKHLKPGGIVACVVYYGHSGGDAEKDALIEHLSQLDQKEFSVLQYGFINQKNKPPFLLAIEKKETD